jgi:hypothetical protein
MLFKGRTTPPSSARSGSSRSSSRGRVPTPRPQLSGAGPAQQHDPPGCLTTAVPRYYDPPGVAAWHRWKNALARGFELPPEVGLMPKPPFYRPGQNSLIPTLNVGDAHASREAPDQTMIGLSTDGRKWRETAYPLCALAKEATTPQPTKTGIRTATPCVASKRSGDARRCEP